MLTPKTITLHWKKFDRLTDARKAFPHKSCVYAQTDSNGHATRVGKATKGLEARYRGGTGYAMDAAMHTSGNLVFVAPVAFVLCDQVESTLIWTHRDQLIYNNQGKRRGPKTTIQIQHLGTPPTFSLATLGRSAKSDPQPVTEPLFPFGDPTTDTRRYLASETLTMHCRFGHDHSAHEVIAAVRNPGLPHEDRPFHCPDCPMTYRPNRKDEYWNTYKTIAEAKEAGQERACVRCFPRRVPRGK